MGDQWSTPRRPVPGLTGALGTVAAVAYVPLLFEPGTQSSYSNEGYNVLAAVIEELTASTFKDYIRKEVLSKAEMTETVLEGGSDDIIPHRAGGGYSTARDLARFGRALRGGKLITPALRDSMWTGRSPIPGFPDEQYGWGSFVQRSGDHKIVGHGGVGTGSGIDTGFRQFTDGSYTIVVLTNMEPPTATRLTGAVVKLIAAPSR
jgi:D-alanyl-D-alanine carboxypeptidase